MNTRNGLIALLFILLPLAFSAELCPQAQQGVQAYQKEDFATAASLWESCVQAGLQNADVYLNLGNAEYRLGHLGKAIWAYESALRIHPTDEDVRANLALVQAQTIDKTEGAGTEADENPVILALWKVHHLCSLNQQMLLVLALAWVLALLIFLTYRTHSDGRRNTLYTVIFTIGICGSVLLLDTAFKVYTQQTDRIAIVLVKSCDVLSGPGDQYQVLHELHEGTRLELRRVQDGWASVRIGDNINGFVKVTELGVVIP